MTSSPSCRRTPRTPVDVRDWNSRTSVALKRIALPWRVARRTSSSSVRSETPIRRSVGSACSSLSSPFSAPSAGARAEAHRDLAGRRDVRERSHAVAPDRAVRRREHDVQAAPLGLVLREREHGRDGFTLRQRQQVDHRTALGVRSALRAASTPSSDRRGRGWRRTAPDCGSRSRTGW